MIHASLCEKTHKQSTWFQGSGPTPGTADEQAQNGVRREPVPNPRGGARRALCASFDEHAQNGVRREPVPNPLGGARRTLCASFDEHAQNGVRREPVPNPLGGARRALCASNTRAPGPFFLLALLFLIAGSLRGQAAPAPVKITSSYLPGGAVGLPYLTPQGGTVQLTATGGVGAPYTWSFSSFSSYNMAGLSFNSNGTITGTPATAGDLSFLVQAFDSAGTGSNAAGLSILISPCSPTLAPASPLPPGDVGVPYPKISFVLSGCAGSTYTFNVEPANLLNSNALPPGLDLSAAGTLKGTPTSAGMFSFLIILTDQNLGQTQLPYSIAINPPPTVTTSSPLPNGPVGVPYSQQIAVTGGTPPYIFSMNNNPPGITITPSGVLNGTPTTVGTYSFNIGVTDSLRAQTVTPFKVTFATAVSEIQVAPLSLTFNADLNGNPPPAQAIGVLPAAGTTLPVNYSVVVDNGQSNTAAPAWIAVTPTSGLAPAGLVVNVDQGALAAGAYLARIQVLDGNGFANDVTVTLNVAGASQQLGVAPSILSFNARLAAPGNLVEELVVSNTGAGVLAFTAAAVGGSSWISSVTAGSGATLRNKPVFIQVQVNTSGLAAGAYHDAILISSPAGNIQIPVSLFVANSGPILGVNVTGVLFQSVEGAPSTATQIVKVLNLGDPTSTVNWTASVTGSASNWLSLVSSSGTATGSAQGSVALALSPNARSLVAGPYYAIIQITDSNSLNSPQYVAAVLDVQPSTSAPTPDLDPAGLFFSVPLGGSAPTPQQVQINAGGNVPVTFDATASTLDGVAWLTVTPASGSATGQASGSIAVSANPAGLAAGIYSGSVNVSIGALLQAVNVTFVVQPASSSSAVASLKPRAIGCAASKLAITETGLADNFAVPEGWPAALIVQLNDDCGSPVANGNVVASFSNGDAPLNLTGDNLGNYSATWQPGAVNASMVVTLNAAAGSLQSATAQLFGGIAQNQTPPPTLVPGGALNNLNPVVGAPLAPGTIASVYGAGLAPAAVSPGVVPLPTMFNNTYALVGPAQAPFYFLSGSQIDIQIPYDVTSAAPQQLPLILSVDNALTLPLTLNIVAAAPGVLSANDGPTPPGIQNGAHIIAQHSSDGSLVSSASPAKPGESLVMYLVGMGPTNPSVASGVLSPGPPSLASVTVQPTVTVDSETSTVLFAGLTPGFVGLYQIDFQVPANASSGELVLTVTQNGVSANPTLLPVSQ